MAREQRGDYIDSLAASWDQDEPGTLPLPIELSAKICGISVRSFRKFVETFPELWQIDGDRLVNPELRAQWVEMQQRQQVLSDAGKRGNAKKYGQSSGGESGGDRSASASASALQNQEPLPYTVSSKSAEKQETAVPGSGHVAARRNPLIEEFSEEVYLALLEFEKFRKRIRKPLTEHALDLLLQRLGELRAQGQDPVKVIDQSIMNGYQGLFPVRGQNGQHESFEERRQRKSAEAIRAVRGRADEILREVETPARLESGEHSADRRLR